MARSPLILLVWASVWALACGGSDPVGDESELECVDIDVDGCDLLYPPTYEQVWTQTFSSSCSGGVSACHDQETGGLTFTDPALTHDLLLDGAHVLPGDPGCSPLMLRLESQDPAFRMPPGETPLSEQARCSIATWIADGALED